MKRNQLNSLKEIIDQNNLIIEKYEAEVLYYILYSFHTEALFTSPLITIFNSFYLLFFLYSYLN